MDSIRFDVNSAAVLFGPEDIRVEGRSLFIQPGYDEVLIRVRATGLCGSDLHYYVHGRNGDFALSHPMCLGHESAGEVVALGKNLLEDKEQGKQNSDDSKLRLGAHVAIEPGLNCLSCEFCKQGRYNLCKSMRFASSAKTVPHLDGTLQRYFTWPARLCHVLPDAIPLRTAALIEPLAVVLQALSRSHMQRGHSVLVMGAGAVGLLTAMAAKAYGASFVAAVDIDHERLEFGKKNAWFDSVHCIEKSSEKATTAATTNDNVPKDVQATLKNAIESSKHLSEQIMQTFKADGHVDGVFDVVYECTGVPSCIQTSIFAAKTGGKVTLIGMGHPIVTLPLSQAALREVDILGVFRYANMFPKAIELLSHGINEVSDTADDADQASTGQSNPVSRVDQLISHVYPLERTVEAFQTLKGGQSEDGKRVVKMLIVDDRAQAR